MVMSSFGEVHQVVVVGVGLVELEHGELGVVLGADAFVAEVAVDLVDAVDAADDQALEVELGRDAEGERDVERVVVGGEGAGGGAAGDGVQHGGFDFEVAAGVEELADGAEDGGALDEDFADVAAGRRRCSLLGRAAVGDGGGAGWQVLRLRSLGLRSAARSDDSSARVRWRSVRVRPWRACRCS